jgi:hypothetical protein
MKCSVHLDDIVIPEETLHVHNEKLREILGRMRKYNLKLQPDNCKFLRKEAFLGHVITKDRIGPRHSSGG